MTVRTACTLRGWATVGLTANATFSPGAFNRGTGFLSDFLTLTVQATARAERIGIAVEFAALGSGSLPNPAIREAVGLIAEVVAIAIREAATANDSAGFDVALGTGAEENTSLTVADLQWCV